MPHAEHAPLRKGKKPKSRTRCHPDHACLGCISRLIAYHPACFMFSILGFCLLISIVGAAGGAYGLTDPTSFDWVLPFQRAALDNEMTSDAVNDAKMGETLVRQEESGSARFWLTYEWESDESIFTPENVQTMCSVEQEFFGLGEYPNFCQINGTTLQCNQPTQTVTHQFYGSIGSCPLLSFESVNATATNLYNNLDDPKLSFFLGISTPSRSPMYSKFSRSVIQMGAPLEGYVSEFDQQAEQDVDYTKYYEDVNDRFISAFNMKSTWLESAYRERQERNGLRVKWYSSTMVDIESNIIASGDFLLAIFSIFFVFGWMTYQMKNLFLSTFCMLQVIFSLPVAIVVYRYVFFISYFQFIHILVIFLVLGIGADDVFVFYDGWRIAGNDPSVLKLIEEGAPQEVYLKKRVEISFESTVGAVFTTSFTTIVSFLATGISPVMPIASFGILAATAILLNFILVCTLVPAILMTNHIWFDLGQRPCCSQEEDDEVDTAEAEALKGNDSLKGNDTQIGDTERNTERITEKNTETNITIESIPRIKHAHSEKKGIELKEMKEGKETKEGKEMKDMKASESGMEPQGERRRSSVHIGSQTDIGRSDSVTTDIEKKGAGGDQKSSAFELNPPDEKEVGVGEAKPDSSLDKLMVYGYYPMMTYKWKGQFVIAWGLFVSFLILGIIGLAFAVRLGPPDEPEQFLPEDHMFAEMSDDLRENFVPGDLSSFVEVTIPFGLDGFDRGDFNKYEPGKNRGSVKYNEKFDFFPRASQEAFLFACNLARSKDCNQEACSFGKFAHPSDDAIVCFLPLFQTWFASRNPGLSTYNCTRSQFMSELQLFRNATTPGISTTDKQKLIGFVSDQLKFVAITVTTSIENSKSTVKKQDARLDVADGLAGQINDIGPSEFGMTTAVAASSTWVGVEAELGIVAGFYQGIALCFPIAFIVLFCNTQNIIISCYAIVSIVFIVGCVLSVVVWKGDALGVGEAIAGVMVIGFSVDYVIHLGHTFIDAMHTYHMSPRFDRFTHTAKSMASTVMAGGITTFGASLPLLACQHRFFPKMGTLMACTVAFSLTFSLLFFMSACLLIGPVGPVGDMSWFMEKGGCADYLRRIGIMHSHSKGKGTAKLEEKGLAKEGSEQAAKGPAKEGSGEIAGNETNTSSKSPHDEQKHQPKLAASIQHQSDAKLKDERAAPADIESPAPDASDVVNM